MSTLLRILMTRPRLAGHGKEKGEVMENLEAELAVIHWALTKEDFYCRRRLRILLSKGWYDAL